VASRSGGAETGLDVPGFGNDGIIDMKRETMFGKGRPIDLVTQEIGLHATPPTTRSSSASLCASARPAFETTEGGLVDQPYGQPDRHWDVDRAGKHGSSRPRTNNPASATADFCVAGQPRSST
jgi:hypothetical protein